MPGATAVASEFTVEIPVDLDLRAHPEYDEAASKLDRLRAELRAAEDRMEEIRTSTSTDRRPIDAQARDLLDGRSATGQSLAELRREFAELDSRLPVLRRAIEMQETEVRRIRNRVSQSIASAIRPGYVDLLRRMMDLAVELGRLADEEQRLRDTLTAHDVAFSGVMPAAPLRCMQTAVEATEINLWLDNLRANYALEPDAPTAGAGFWRRSR